MTENQLNDYNAAYSKVKQLKLNIRDLIDRVNINNEASILSPYIDLGGTKLSPEIGGEVLLLALNLCEQELIKAQKEFDEL